RQRISDLTGTMSFVIWLFAQSPQLYENYRNGSVDGLSPVFLTQWMLGDVTNLIGSVLTGQLPFQIAVATYFCCVDACILVQFVYYWNKGSTPPRDSFEPSEHALRRRQLLQLSNCRPASQRVSHVGKQLSLENPPAEQRPRPEYIGFVIFGPSYPIAAGLLDAISGGGSAPPTWQRLVGRMAAWTCTVLYITSRIPQIWENYIRRSVQGLSILLFISAFLGNLLYTISILTNPEAVGEGRREYLQESIPFLLGSGGTLIFDLMIVIQWWMWS
ncbi:hypothetical protein BCV70DRAFT_152864, partial [Testicularia cyperi]